MNLDAAAVRRLKAQAAADQEAAAPAMMPRPELIGTGGLISIRVDVQEVEPGRVEKVAVLRAQQGRLIGVDCPMTGENVDVLIKHLQLVRAELGPGGGLVVAKGLPNG